MEITANCMKIRNTGCSLHWADRHAEEPEQTTLRCPQEEHLLEFDGQRNGVEEDVNLEDAEEEEAEMFKHFCKEIPEEADVGSQVRNGEAAGREAGNVNRRVDKRSLKPLLSSLRKYLIS